ncbi:MAG: 2,3,4,5-tetrahydropyridine-2,6-dicarboxylate N-succinyltransferase [Azospirillum brasilense]|nr:MAG: 2,3,4,5-tetrahydropyridine-2,6-dicarboxylate N-succinyltransferase [Azospirillum brasilense]
MTALLKTAPAALESTITAAWEARAEITTKTTGDVRDAVNAVLAAVDAGQLRVAEKQGKDWQVNQWVKQAILLSFRLNDNALMEGVAGAPFFDKVPLKCEGWGEEQFRAAGFRAVPGSIVRRGSFVDKSVVLMPSFINIGAYVGEGTMVDTWVTIGSCAQIGKHCHISGGVGIGGVLEPLQANPVIIEDNCFIGARSEVAEGVIVEEGSVISMGVFLGASTKIVDRATGEVFYGRVPAYSVVVPGTLPGKTPDAPHLAAAIIVKRVDEKTRSKTSINELLRD